MAHIQTPEKGFTGTVAGVDFKDGIGTTDDEGAIAYFERQGYDVTPHAPKAPAKKAPAKGQSTPPKPEPAEGDKAAD